MKIEETAESDLSSPVWYCQLPMKAALRNVLLGALGAVALCLSACGAQKSEPPAKADILLFVGVGTSPGDVAAVEGILLRTGRSASAAKCGARSRMVELEAGWWS